jgi:hypothetical protein
MVVIGFSLFLDDAKNGGSTVGEAKRRKKSDPQWGKVVPESPASDEETLDFTPVYRAMVSLSAALSEKTPFIIEAEEAAKRATYYAEIERSGVDPCPVCGLYGCWEDCSKYYE